jgi:hypothetical protein
MRRALQRASTFQSSPEPPEGVTDANIIVMAMELADENEENEINENDIVNLSVNAGVVNPKPVAKKSQKRVSHKSGNLSESKYHTTGSTGGARRATTNRGRKKATKTSKTFPSSGSAPQLPQVNTQIRLNEVLPKIVGHWVKPVKETPVAGDLHRLAGRITIKDYRDGQRNIYSLKEGEPKEIVRYIITHLNNILEKDQTKKEQLSNYLETTSSKNTEIKYWTEQLLNITGEDSKITSLCKTISQNIISPVATQIKIIFAVTNGLIKDASSSPDGWKILLKFTDDQITSTHIRKETSVSGGTNSFEFDWKLRIKFSQDLDKLEKVDLELFGLKCTEEMPNEQKEKILDIMNQMVVD